MKVFNYEFRTNTLDITTFNVITNSETIAILGGISVRIDEMEDLMVRLKEELDDDNNWVKFYELIILASFNLASISDGATLSSYMRQIATGIEELSSDIDFDIFMKYSKAFMECCKGSECDDTRLTILAYCLHIDIDKIFTY